jgi:hypothetical protein
MNNVLVITKARELQQKINSLTTKQIRCVVNQAAETDKTQAGLIKAFVHWIKLQALCQTDAYCSRLFWQVQQFLYDTMSLWLIKTSRGERLKANDPIMNYNVIATVETNAVILHCIEFYKDTEAVIREYYRDLLIAQFKPCATPIKQCEPVLPDSLKVSMPNCGQYLAELEVYILRSKSFYARPNPESMFYAELLSARCETVPTEFNLDDVSEEHLIGHLVEKNNVYYQSSVAHAYMLERNHTTIKKKYSENLACLKIFYIFYRLDCYCRFSLMSHEDSHINSSIRRWRLELLPIIKQYSEQYLAVITQLLDSQTLLIYFNNQRQDNRLTNHHIAEYQIMANGLLAKNLLLKNNISLEDYITLCKTQGIRLISSYKDSHFTIAHHKRQHRFIYVVPLCHDKAISNKIAICKLRINLQRFKDINHLQLENIFLIIHDAVKKHASETVDENKTIMSFKIANYVMLEKEKLMLDLSNPKNINYAKSLDRFLLGGQYTIYLFDSFNIDRIVQFIKEINLRLSNLHVKPGQIPSSDIKLNHYFSITVDRQDEQYISAVKRDINATVNSAVVKQIMAKLKES